MSIKKEDIMKINWLISKYIAIKYLKQKIEIERKVNKSSTTVGNFYRLSLKLIELADKKKLKV